MARVQATLIQEDEAYINFHVDLDTKKSTGYESNVELYNKDDKGWIAVMKFEGMAPQGTPEDAIDMMGLYLEAMSKAMKGENIKHLNIGELFKPVSK